MLHLASSTTWLFACNDWIDERVNFARLLRVRGAGEPDPRLLVRPCCLTRHRTLPPSTVCMLELALSGW